MQRLYFESSLDNKQAKQVVYKVFETSARFGRRLPEDMRSYPYTLNLPTVKVERRIN